MKMPVESPPYRKIRALRLCETPATPRTLFKKATTETPAQNRFIRKPLASPFPPQTPNNRPKAFAVHNKTFEPVTANINPFSPSSMFAYSAPVNQFNLLIWPNLTKFVFFSGFLANKKRSRNEEQCRTMRTSTESLMNKSNASINSMDEDVAGDNFTDDEWQQAPKRLALHDSDIPRYEKEFVELSLIGMNLYMTLDI